MKLILPLFNELGLQSGFSIQNPTEQYHLKKEPNLSITLLKNFEIISQKTIEFKNQSCLRVFLPEIFDTSSIKNAGIATIEFSKDSVDLEDQGRFFKNSFEGNCVFKNPINKKTAGLLFDFIPDKKPGHIYAPILHCAHSAYISAQEDCYTVLANFRPISLKPDQMTHRMKIQLKSPQGQLLGERSLDLLFNHTDLISIGDLFQDIGGFYPGCTVNFKGGASQFVIFTLFINRATGSMGIEHSLAPLYYCSGSVNPETRTQFYKNAFAGMEIKR
jgi:hypothetical protein